jgi:hypothetical protein
MVGGFKNKRHGKPAIVADSRIFHRDTSCPRQPDINA